MIKRGSHPGPKIATLDSSILQKWKIYGFFYQPPNPILTYSCTDTDAVKKMANEVVEYWAVICTHPKQN
jgi:hypothetical protein